MERRRLLGLVLAVVLGTFLAGMARGAEPLASGETSWDGVTVHVMSLVRKHGILTLKIAAVNSGKESARLIFDFTGDNACYLVDEENGTKYFVLTDKKGAPLASGNEWVRGGHGILRDVAPGKTLRVWMKFPAPPTEVKTISIFLNETEPIEDVPITDR
ncbi:MAG TPA: hypothetical protein ENK19_02455 [Acidobacteria bacterium]|nr:hypothetical protein [Acidobacteriota bacterium]